MAHRKNPKDIGYMIEALTLAAKGRGLTSPNPMVGAVLVKNGRIIGSGWHRRAGLPHAEIEAIKNSRQPVKGSTLYVTLEPCGHFGRTAPCVDEIIRQGIKHVVAAVKDPNPLMSGKSLKKLRKAGIKVDLGLAEQTARQLNEVFFLNMAEKRPFVAAKAGQTLDGKIASVSGRSRWITGEKSRAYAKSLRDRYDAVAVGIGTVLADDPRLNGLKKIPWKVVIDPQLKISRNCRLLKETADKTIVIASALSRGKEKNIPAKVIFVKPRKGILPLRQVLKSLYQLGVTSLFVEGGGETIGRFFEERLVDKVYFFIAPKILGGSKAVPSVGAQGFVSPQHCPQLVDITVKPLDRDILFVGYPVYSV